MLEPEVNIMLVGVVSLLVPEAVPLVRIEHEFEFFSEVDELIDQLNGILHVNIVVHSSMSKE